MPISSIRPHGACTKWRCTDTSSVLLYGDRNDDVGDGDTTGDMAYAAEDSWP